VTTLWVTIIVFALANAAIKAAGPVPVGGRDPPARATAIIALLALVVTETFGEGRHWSSMDGPLGQVSGDGAGGVRSARLGGSLTSW
jgi:hypothetical protein